MNDLEPTIGKKFLIDDDEAEVLLLPKNESSFTVSLKN